jgi:hypothetical protein
MRVSGRLLMMMVCGWLSADSAQTSAMAHAMTDHPRKTFSAMMAATFVFLRRTAMMLGKKGYLQNVVGSVQIRALAPMSDHSVKRLETGTRPIANKQRHWLECGNSSY